VCHCGINIAATVNVKEVVDYVATLPYVVHSQELMFACSQDAQKLITEKIHDLTLNRIIVAACTPRTHEPLFQNTLKNSGLNPYLFEFTNIREQCSWVHQKEPEKATDKAKELVKMSVYKAMHLEPLSKTKLMVNHNSLIIGGGLAGMTAALDLASQNYHVDLVERERELGGNLRHLAYTLEGEETKPFLQSLIEQVMTHPHITVHRNAEIQEIQGFIGNYKTTITYRSDTKDRQYMDFGDTEAAERQEEIDHGIVIVATGAREYEPKEYFYGQDERVMTQRELEAKISEKHPDLHHVNVVVMIQCVGSRNDDNPYCSRVCCSTAIKNALKLKQLNPHIQVFVLYRDIRTYGIKEIYYKKAREAGVIFIQYDEGERPEVTKDGDALCVEVREKIMNKIIHCTPDVLVLSNGIVPHDDNKILSQALKVPLGTDGFFLEAHVKLRPVDFATDGVFVCGLAHYPKDIRETIAQAKAAAARAVTVLSKEEIEAEGKVASVTEARCSGCGLCVEVCAYRAIDLDTEKHVATVNEALCKGCGTCAASCRSSAINLKGFKDEQILAAVAAL
jgi:heterodisulfide reductase subunit A